MEPCECGHINHGIFPNLPCIICGCTVYEARHDPAYDADDVADQGYSDEGYPYSGLGKVRR